jgi:hypothetical protein
MERLRARLSFANVMSVIAVFIALGGTGYAAVKLPKNSVGSKELKSNAVSSSKVKNGSLTKSDFRASDLPVGPAGAQGAQGPQGLQGLKGDPGTNGTNGTNGANGADGADGAPGTVGAATTVFFQAPADLADGNNMSYGAFCPAGKQAIAGGGRGDDTLSEQTILTNTRPAISSSNTEPPLAGQGFKGWRITVVNPTGGTATSGIRPEVWVVCVDAPTP